MTTTALDGAVYFNCWTDNTAPNWADFKSLEICGCRMIPDPEGYYVQGNQAPDDSAFWTIYGREHDGCALAITDCGLMNDAYRIAAELSALSGLPIV